MSSFSDEELTEIKEIFGYFAPKDSDKMPSESLGTLLRGLGKNPLESEIEAMLKENGSDTVDFATFLTFMEKPLREKKQFKEKDIVEAFSVFDADESGVIDKNELRKILCDLGEPFKSDEFELFMSAADPEGTGKVSYKEFVAEMMSKKKEKADD